NPSSTAQTSTSSSSAYEGRIADAGKKGQRKSSRTREMHTINSGVHINSTNIDSYFLAEMIPSRRSRSLLLLLLLFSSILLRASSQTNAAASAIHVEESTRREVAAVGGLRGGSRGGGGGRSPVTRGSSGAAAGGSGSHSAACSSYGRHVAITSLAFAIGAAIVNSM
ncbi:hypothetical protein MUK42_23336, partial [Musa troglodytarum]